MPIREFATRNSQFAIGVRSKVLAAVALLLVLVQPALAQRDLKDIPVPDAEEERKSFRVADGFQVNLFASDPKIAKPIQMNFGPDGRLWIASSEVYPHIAPGQKANDKILVVEDADGDGVAEKTTVFAEGLFIPTGVLPGDGGVYVANSTELLHFKDTDGDGKADSKRVVLSGFGTEDTHHMLHTLRWGSEGFLYMNQSIYIHTHIETPYGVKRLGGGGIWWFRPDNLKMDVFMRGLVNPWGHQLDHFGQSFATDGAGGEGINHVVTGAYYFTAVGASRILHGLNPGSPKYCGLEIVSGQHLPDDWQGNLITNDFRGHRVCRFRLDDDGSGFVSRQEKNLIETEHGAFRPIDVSMGSDGAIYIADWYNPIIQHGEVDFRDPRRDHTHGRIWRVTHKARPVVPNPKLPEASTRTLLDQLQSPEGWTRRNAAQVLRESGKEKVLPELRRWVAEIDAKRDDADQFRLSALWIYQALDVVEPRLLAALLESNDFRIRAAATRVIQYWKDRLDAPLDLLAARIRDEHPRVRLEAVRALAGIPEVRSAELALSALDQKIDVNLEYALWLASRELAPQWLPGVASGELDFSGNVLRQIFALESLGTPESVPPLVRLLTAGKVSADQMPRVLAVVASLGGTAELRLVFDAATRADNKVPPEVRRALWSSMAEAGRKRNVRPDGDLSAIGPILNGDDAELKRFAASCAGFWKLEELRAQLGDLAGNASVDDEIRAAAMEGLVSLGGEETRRLLERLAAPKQSRITRLQATSALASLDLSAAAVPAVVLLKESNDSAGNEGPDALFAAFVERKGGPEALAAALDKQSIPPDVAKRGTRIVSSSGREYPALHTALITAGGITGGPRILTAEEMKSLVALVKEQGSAERGEAIFRRGDLSCFKCHSIGGVGGVVGPDLLSIGTSAQVDYLIDSLLQPNKHVKENYHTLVIQTDEGKVLTGIKVRQTDSELVLRDVEDREVSVPLGSIEEQTNGASIMPAGLTDKLTERELLDLVRFLSELGKPGPYAVGTARVIRRWQMLTPTREAGDRIRSTSFATAASDFPEFVWAPAYASVAGNLSTDVLAGLRATYAQKPGDRNTAFLRCELRATSAGNCRLKFNSTAGLQLWNGTTPVAVTDEILLPISEGTCRLTLSVNLDERSEPIRLEVLDGPSPAANVQIVGGK
ncbi:MAG: PVC-type heme-binding CxxCH protein [Planctomycetaceae bacterium]